MNLQKGFYVFQWIYDKDFSVSTGEDGAFLKVKFSLHSIPLKRANKSSNFFFFFFCFEQFIELGGTTYADNSCTPCPAGTFSNTSGQEDCLPCPVNTYSNSTGISGDHFTLLFLFISSFHFFHFLLVN
jgi:hypothetical protein